MLYDAADEPETLSTDELLTTYATELQAVVDDVGADTVVAETDLDRETVDAVVAGDVADLTLEEAAAVLAVSPNYPDQRGIVLEVRDHLLMGMTTAVLDVDTIAANIDVDLTGQEVQQAIEGRTPMTLTEFAAIHRLIAERKDR
ncbi:hypothetical protein SAMN04487948_102342 [Halogranum amylolyticum]|uniref:Uncharacterized protein n=1 Tax=Halogranum amylolyticum TaxID=660520 RepID=A0A1H8PJS9_9EURY|nr:DUF5791 family protein [Halogranum amylolyticum]SEO42046.1 hypothetical protein SAMN04487948_102342 [Halogranum amylolyticum]